MDRAVVPRWVRALRIRGFSNPDLEAEFLTAYRSHGSKFIIFSTTVGAACYLAFMVIDAVLHGLFTEPAQFIRAMLVAFLFMAAISARLYRGFVTRHYGACCTTIMALTMLASGRLAQLNQINTPTSLCWTLTTVSVLATLMVYGFVRMKPRATLTLGLLIALMALSFGQAAASAEPASYVRMVTHIVAANVLGLCIYRLTLGRERKLFLQSRRKNHVAELRRMKEQAEAANRAKTAFLANMSHEIRTPMNGVIGALSMLNESSLPERDRLFVKSARDSARNLLHLLNEILDFAKLDAQKVRLSPAPCDPRDLIVAACEAFGATAMQKGIGLRADTTGIPAEVHTLLADEGKLRQVLLNLVSNAVKFTQQGEVVVSASMRDLHEGSALLVIDVSDTGVGIPEAALEQLYQPFFQVESGNRRSYGGTGLGLAICKQIIEEMGGVITTRSVQGVGTTFEIRLTLPYGDEAGAHGELALREAGFQDTRPPDDRDIRLQGHVLLVEDNEVNAFIATMTLESLGISSHHAKNGAVAVQMAQEGRYDVILMDCEMPVMDGYEAVRQIRDREARHPDVARTPIVALTAHALTGDREVCLQGGMDDYLTKPFDRGMLAHMLLQWLPAGRAAHTTVNAINA